MEEVCQIDPEKKYWVEGPRRIDLHLDTYEYDPEIDELDSDVERAAYSRVHAFYNRYYRLWDGLPTEAEMTETPWADEQEEGISE
jgi:hypothetical protein